MSTTLTLTTNPSPNLPITFCLILKLSPSNPMNVLEFIHERTPPASADGAPLRTSVLLGLLLPVLLNCDPQQVSAVRGQVPGHMLDLTEPATLANLGYHNRREQ